MTTKSSPFKKTTEDTQLESCGQATLPPEPDNLIHLQQTRHAARGSMS